MWLCLAEFFDTYGNMISTVALIITLGVFIWYAWETRKLRKETVKQTELSIRPFIVIYEGSPGELTYNNIGHSHAFNVEIEPVETNLWVANFHYYNLIKQEEMNKKLPITFKGKNEDKEAMIRGLVNPPFTPSELKSQNIDDKYILNIKYRNFENVLYITQEKITKKGIEFIFTRKISK